MSSRSEIPPMAPQVKLMIGGLIALMILIAVISLWPKRREDYAQTCPDINGRPYYYDRDTKKCHPYLD